MADSSKRKLSDMEDLDEETAKNRIQGKVWAKQLLSSAQKITRKAVLNWCNVVNNIGDSEVNVNEYVANFLHQIETLYEDLIVNVETIQEKTLDEIRKLQAQMENLCLYLHVEIPDFNFEQLLSLTEVKNVLGEKVAELEALVDIRRNELQQLNQKQFVLCKRLGKEPKLLPESPLPPQKEIEDLKAFIDKLVNETLEREEKFFQLKEQIERIVEEFNITPNLDFEKEILEMLKVKITDDDLMELQQYHERLQHQSSSIRSEIKELRLRIDDLWNKLETDIAERDLFRLSNQGYSTTVLHSLRREAKRLEEARKDTMHIFPLMQKYKERWDDLIKLNARSESPNRFKNRRGELLAEEKSRNKLLKRIRSTEQELRQAADAYESQTGVKFLTFGRTIQEYMVTFHENHDKETKERLSAKKLARERASSKSPANLFPPSTSAPKPSLTPENAPKRKLLTTQSTAPTKKIKPSVPVQQIASARPPTLNISKSRRLSKQKRRQRRSLKASSPASSKKNHEVTSSDTSYSAFQEGVSSETNRQSTKYLVPKIVISGVAPLAATP